MGKKPAPKYNLPPQGQTYSEALDAARAVGSHCIIGTFTLNRTKFTIRRNDKGRWYWEADAPDGEWLKSVTRQNESLRKARFLD